MILTAVKKPITRVVIVLLLLSMVNINGMLVSGAHRKPHKKSSTKLETATEEKLIRTMLADQVKEWNKGNIDGYMSGYWNSDSMLFIGSSGPRYGFEKTLERYKEAYPDKAHMGRLISNIITITPLSREYYFVVGHWELKREVGDVGGSFTLLLRKMDGNWVIVCDHSS